MQFFDRVNIKVQSGSGGDGCATGRRETHVAYGGPSGGDGGTGGSVYFIATPNEYTLMPFRANKVYKATSGEHGKGKDKYGKGGEDIILKVPVGTIITDTETGRHYASLDTPGARCCIVRGGIGGLGNIHFVNAQVQYSTIAFHGEPAQKRDITLELQLLSDIALIGSPSVGKSSLINLVSNSKAKVAEYHFTTLTPNLGIISHLGTSFSMIDIPGLIEGAHEGKGLGYEFLRHIIKSRVLLFVTDLNRFESGIDEMIQILDELRLYCIEQFGKKHEGKKIICGIIEREGVFYYQIHANEELLMEKQLGFVCNKVDLVYDEEVTEAIVEELYNRFSGYVKETFGGNIDHTIFNNSTFIVSAATGFGKESLLMYCKIAVENEKIKLNEVDNEVVDITIDETKEIAIADISKTEVPKLIEDGYLPEDAKKYPSIWSIEHPKVGFYAYVIPRGNDEAELWFWTHLAQQGIMDWMEKAGVKKGDVLKVVSPYKQRKDLLIRRD